MLHAESHRVTYSPCEMSTRPISKDKSKAPPGSQSLLGRSCHTLGLRFSPFQKVRSGQIMSEVWSLVRTAVGGHGMLPCAVRKTRYQPWGDSEHLRGSTGRAFPPSFPVHVSQQHLSRALFPHSALRLKNKIGIISVKF